MAGHCLPLGPVEAASVLDHYSLQLVGPACAASVSSNVCRYLVERAAAEGTKYLCICVPCYNEESLELLKTLLSLLSNMEFLERKVPTT
jgi:hypothetical protein